MNSKKLLILVFFLPFFWGCSNNKKEIIEPKNKIPQIISFKLLAKDNENLDEDILATIDHTTKNITAILPSHTSLNALVPTIIKSEGVNITPNNQTPQDFSKEITYKLSGDGFEEVEYSVIVTVMPSDEANIIDFQFLQTDNSNLKEDISAIIEDNTIKVEFSEAVDISSLIPSIKVSNGASISPDSETPQDFTKDVKYTITAQNGTTKVEYTVEVTSLSSDTKITKFQFTVNGNTYDADIDNILFRITLKLPYNTDLNNLAPIIEINEAAGITPASGQTQDFNSAVVYEITAEDDSKQKYIASIITMTDAENDRAVLEEFYNVNKNYNPPFTYLDWDLDAPNMDNWSGVTISNGRVTDLSVSLVYIDVIPASIGELSELKSLTFSYVKLTEIPKQIGNLEKLEYLNLTDNKLITLPPEIGNLLSLKSLDVNNNTLEYLPGEIGNLDNLMNLYLQKNSLTQLPIELANLPKLLSLNIKDNPLTIIPEQICNMTTDIGGYHVIITKDDEDTCE